MEINSSNLPLLWLFIGRCIRISQLLPASLSCNGVTCTVQYLTGVDDDVDDDVEFENSKNKIPKVPLLLMMMMMMTVDEIAS